ncbi:hypothetical protein BHM03_00035641 [Ensete ventricosum]|nr:hypothetical protein BHM03_00035641 [Ensete ventricosum]
MCASSPTVVSVRSWSSGIGRNLGVRLGKSTVGVVERGSEGDSTGAYIVGVVDHPYLATWLPLWLTMLSHTSTMPAVLAVGHASAGKGVGLTCVRPTVRPLAPPYLRPASFPRRVGHVGGPVVRGGPTCTPGVVNDISCNKLLQVVLVSPQIPGNTGCIARTCAASAVGLHLVGVRLVRIDFTYKRGDWLVFGSETSGLPPEALFDCSAEGLGGGTIRIPMVETYVRCLNLSVSVGIAMYEASRQLNYEQFQYPLSSEDASQRLFLSEDIFG